jgi:transposase-like protein
VITFAVRWYLRYGLSYRDMDELLAERGITVDHVTVYRWVRRFTPLLIDAARPASASWSAPRAPPCTTIGEGHAPPMLVSTECR